MRLSRLLRCRPLRAAGRRPPAAAAGSGCCVPLRAAASGCCAPLPTETSHCTNPMRKGDWQQVGNLLGLAAGGLHRGVRADSGGMCACRAPSVNRHVQPAPRPGSCRSPSVRREALDALNLSRYCCRRMLMTHVSCCAGGMACSRIQCQRPCAMCNLRCCAFPAH